MKIRPFLLVPIMLLIAAIAVFGSRAALATDKTPKPADPVTKQEQGQAQQQHQKQAQGQHQQSHASSEAVSGDSISGSDSVSSSSNEGVENNSTTNSNFLALGLTFPGIAGECGRGVQGGGQDDGKAAFLGFNWLDKNCRAQALAAGAVDPMQHAMLACADKVFRNAIAYDYKRKERQQVCIDRTYDTNRKFVNVANAEIAENARLKAENQKLLEQKAACLSEYAAKRDELVYCYQKADEATK